MADTPILYTFRRCPYAMRARMALVASGTVFAWREILLKDKPAAMLEVSPKGTAPVLVLDDGRVIDESLDIMLWALERNDPRGWLSPDDGERARQMALIARNDGPFKQHLDRYKYATRYDDADPEAEREAGFEVLRVLDQLVAENGFLAGATVGLADIAIFPFVRQFRIADPDWFDAQDIAPLQGWLSGLMDSQLFQDIMIKRQPWSPGDPEILFNA